MSAVLVQAMPSRRPHLRSEMEKKVGTHWHSVAISCPTRTGSSCSRSLAAASSCPADSRTLCTGRERVERPSEAAKFPAADFSAGGVFGPRQTHALTSSAPVSIQVPSLYLFVCHETVPSHARRACDRGTYAGTRSQLRGDCQASRPRDRAARDRPEGSSCYASAKTAGWRPSDSRSCGPRSS